MDHSRYASSKDLSAVSALVNSAYRGESSRAGWTTEADLLDGQRTDFLVLNELIQTPDNHLLLFFKDAEESVLLGSVHLRIENTHCLYLGMLAVVPALQGKGIGKAILNEIEKIGREFGCTECRMTVIPVRVELIQFYERRGYQKTGIQEAFPTDPKFGVKKVQNLTLIELKKIIGPYDEQHH